MKNLKKFLILGLVLIMAFSMTMMITGCGGSEEPAPAEEPAEEPVDDAAVLESSDV